MNIFNKKNKNPQYVIEDTVFDNLSDVFDWLKEQGKKTAEIRIIKNRKAHGGERLENMIRKIKVEGQRIYIWSKSHKSRRILYDGLKDGNVKLKRYVKNK